MLDPYIFYLRHRSFIKRWTKNCLVFVLLATPTYFFYSHLFVVKKYAITDPDGNPTACAQHIHTALTPLADAKNLSIASIVETIEQQCPYIQHLSVSLLPRNTAKIEVSVCEPYCLINDHDALLINGSVVPIAYVERHNLEGLSRITIQDWYTNDSEVPPLLPEIILSLDAPLLQHYDITWNSDNEIFLVNKHTPTFSVLFEKEALPSYTMHQKCEEIRNSLASRGVLETPTHKMWVADVRFKDQIILFIDRGGRGHGPNVY